MIDIGLTNALAQIRDALYEVADAIRESKENEDKWRLRFLQRKKRKPG